jgi:microcystin-dependent protein
MATTQILPFCTNAAGSGGNRLTPTAYAALTSVLANGFQSGLANSVQANTALAQSSFMAAGLANWMVSQGVSVPDDGNLTNLVTEINSALTAFSATHTNPSGTVIAFAASTAPTGYLECAGAAISRTTYATLFGVIGTTFGVGDGSTTFNLPDLRGQFVRGWADSGSVDSGRTFGSTQAYQVGPHSHPITDPGHTHTITQSTNSVSGGANPVATAVSTGTGVTTSSSTTGITVNNNTGTTESRPTNVALMYCIKT